MFCVYITLVNTVVIVEFDSNDAPVKQWDVYSDGSTSGSYPPNNRPSKDYLTWKGAIAAAKAMF